MNNEQELLKTLGEETIYTAKGHFKAHDLRHILISSTIWLCAVLNVSGIVWFDLALSKWISVAGLFGTMALLIWNQGEDKHYRARHKKAAEKYLSFHKEVRKLYLLKNYDGSTFNNLNESIKELDESDRPNISWMAKKWAQRAIRKGEETDNWFEE